LPADLDRNITFTNPKYEFGWEGQRAFARLMTNPPLPTQRQPRCRFFTPPSAQWPGATFAAQSGVTSIQSSRIREFKLSVLRSIGLTAICFLLVCRPDFRPLMLGLNWCPVISFKHLNFRRVKGMETGFSIRKH
jgi:hypothetical protein